MSGNVGPLSVNRSHPLAVGRRHWWLALPGRTAGGARWLDLMGTLHATPSGGPTWRGPSRPGGRGHLLFDGTDDHAATASAPSHAAFTVGAWVRPDAVNSQWHHFVGHQIDGNNRQFNLTLSSGTYQTPANTLALFVRTNLGDYSTATAAVTAGVWYRVIGTFDGSNIAIYLDGRLASTAGATGTPTTPTTAITIGNLFNSGTPVSGESFAGAMDDVVYASRVWSASEVALDYRLSRMGHPGLLVRGNPALLAAPAGGGGGPAVVVRRSPSHSRSGSRGIA